MPTPRLLVGTAILFWGWQAKFLPIAVIMAVALEGAQIVHIRWNLTSKEFKRISDLCTLILAGMVVYHYAGIEPVTWDVLKWMPMAFFPLVLAQVFSTTDKIDLDALFLLFRLDKSIKRSPKKRIDLTYPFFMLCILSAGAANVRGDVFFVGIFILTAWALWYARPSHFSPFFWLMMLMVAGIVGYAGQSGLHRLHLFVEKNAFDWFTASSQNLDPFHNMTAIGEIGALKPSKRIIFRVESKKRSDLPLLLHEASYDIYRFSTWLASRTHFARVKPEADRSTWILRPNPKQNHRELTVYAPLKGGRALLKWPRGVQSILEMPVAKLETTPFGVMRVEQGPGLLAYKIKYDPQATTGVKPGKKDLFIPDSEKQVIEKIVQELDLKSFSDPQKISKMVSFFQNHFKYSLIQKSFSKNLSPLSNFLANSRAGHCELFATAAVLLLRSVNIPARYATGYLAHEYSELEGKFIVRMSHAHAWTLFYLNGTWQNLDTTPSDWVEIEKPQYFFSTYVGDMFSYLGFKLSRFFGREKDSRRPIYAMGLLAVLIFIILIRIFKNKKIAPGKKTAAPKMAISINPASDSEIYLIEKRLNQLGFSRRPWETFSEWFSEITQSNPNIIHKQFCETTIRLHRRYRFDPKGIPVAEKDLLIQTVHKWLQHLNSGIGVNP